VRDLGDLTIEKADNTSFVLRDSNGRLIEPDEGLREWEFTGEEHPSLPWQMNSATLLMCCLDIREGQVLLTPKPPDIEAESLAQYALNSGIGISMFYIDYTGTAKEAVAVETPYPTANRNHTLSRIARESKYASQLTDLQRFARSFVPCIATTVSIKEKTPCMDKPDYWQKRVGYLFFDVQWTQYDSTLRPPYKIWTRKTGWIDFDKEDFAKWRDAPVKLE
jgi:hypothetical protein